MNCVICEIVSKCSSVEAVVMFEGNSLCMRHFNEALNLRKTGVNLETNDADQDD